MRDSPHTQWWWEKKAKKEGTSITPSIQLWQDRQLTSSASLWRENSQLSIGTWPLEGETEEQGKENHHRSYHFTERPDIWIQHQGDHLSPDLNIDKRVQHISGQIHCSGHPDWYPTSHSYPWCSHYQNFSEKTEAIIRDIHLRLNQCRGHSSSKYQHVLPPHHRKSHLGGLYWFLCRYRSNLP